MVPTMQGAQARASVQAHVCLSVHGCARASVHATARGSMHVEADTHACVPWRRRLLQAAAGTMVQMSTQLHHFPQRVRVPRRVALQMTKAHGTLRRRASARAYSASRWKGHEVPQMHLPKGQDQTRSHRQAARYWQSSLRLVDLDHTGHHAGQETNRGGGGGAQVEHRMCPVSVHHLERTRDDPAREQGTGVRWFLGTYLW